MLWRRIIAENLKYSGSPANGGDLETKSIVVFGGSGFLASAVVRQLLRFDCKVTIVDRVEPADAGLANVVIFDVNDDIRSLPLDLLSFDYIFNFVAQPDIEASKELVVETFNTNLMFNIRLLEELRRRKSRALYIFASSVYAVSSSGLFYGVSKWAAEKSIREYHKLFGQRFLILRYGSVYGPGSSTSNRIFRFVDQALRERRITFMGDGSEEREFIHVKDAANLTIQLLQAGKFNHVFMLTGTERYTYLTIGKILKELLGGDIELDFRGLDYSGHYFYTPYSFTTDQADKVVPNYFQDIGAGLIEVAEYIWRGQNGSRSQSN